MKKLQASLVKMCNGLNLPVNSNRNLNPYNNRMGSSIKYARSEEGAGVTKSTDY